MLKIGQRQRVNTSKDAKSEIINIQIAFFGLLALLLAFNFTLASNRFEMRKQIMMEQSNAIETSYLRINLLPPSEQLPLQNAYRVYVNDMLEFFQREHTITKLKYIDLQIRQIQDQIWSLAMAAIAKNQQPIYSALYIISLNNVFDEYNSFITSTFNHVPDASVYLLFIVSLFTMGLIGYSNGLDNKPNKITMILCSIVIALVITIILDLDRPFRGLIQMSDKNYIDLQQTMNAVEKTQ